MNSNNRKRYILAMALPLLILVGLTLIPLFTIFYGETVFLKTKPVDPRDLFRGDYVILDYEISEIEPAKLSTEIIDSHKNGDYYRLHGKDIFVVLKQTGLFHEVDYATLDNPKGDALYIKGKISYFHAERHDFFDELDYEKTDQMELLYMVVNYNLDRYFVPENTGLELEDLSRQGQLVAELKVANGYASLVDIAPLDDK